LSFSFAPRRILQDPGLAFHPPLLYLGYVGFSIAFSFAIAALLEGRIDAAWARWVRPWVLGAWMCLTLGIAGGSYWAYYELGWGGYWFWDPVENASLMPWLAATALLHSAIVMEKRDALKIWTILLAILAFSLSLMGTFLVRSGVLTSVHAFATDPTRGVFILVILVIFIGGALTLFAFRAGSLTPGGVFAPISREGALILNNLFLTAAAATVVVGTLYPLALEALGGTRISVGAPFFDLTFVPLVVPLLMLVPFGPHLAWKRGDLKAASERLLVAFAAAIAVAILAAVLEGATDAFALFGVWLGTWLVAGAITELAYRIKVGTASLAENWRRLAGLPRSTVGTTVAHAGLGVTVLGLIIASTWGSEAITSVKPGGSVPIAGYTLKYQGPIAQPGPNYAETLAPFSVTTPWGGDMTMQASHRLYSVSQTTTSEAAIKTIWFSQLYLSLGDIAQDGTATVHVYFKPLVTFIWLGAIIMALGGALSLTDRRLRVGAPRPARAASAIPAAPAE
jgi:cytochrome c-type biogenesis protein CcmF